MPKSAWLLLFLSSEETVSVPMEHCHPGTGVGVGVPGSLTQVLFVTRQAGITDIMA